MPFIEGEPDMDSLNAETAAARADHPGIPVWRVWWPGTRHCPGAHELVALKYGMRYGADSREDLALALSADKRGHAK